MIQIVIGDDSYLIPENQVHWFKTLEHAAEYTTPNVSTDQQTLIRLPTTIADQSIDIKQFQELIECYRTQIDNNLIDYKRPRSMLEHYLDGILDDVDGQTGTILDFILELESIVVDFKLYQMVSNYRGTISNKISNSNPHLIFKRDEIKDNLTSRIARLGSLEIFIHLFTYLDHSQVCIILSAYGQLDMLQYAHEHNCKFPAYSIRSIAIEYKHFSILEYVYYRNTQDCYPQINSLESLQYLHENGFPWEPYTCEYAAQKGFLEILQYAHENGCPWNEWTCLQAARRGHLNCLQYAHEHGCPWNFNVCAFAAETGHLSCLQYAHENGCPWEDKTCSYAARNGHLDCLRYAHENGCSWRYNVCESAAMGGHLDCLKYAHENGCFWDHYIYESVNMMSGNDAIIQYLIHHGCSRELIY